MRRYFRSHGEGSVVDRVALWNVLNRFLCPLPHKTRVVLLRRYWYMNSICEIADDLGMRDGSVRVLLFRTRQKLQKFLRKEGLLKEPLDPQDVVRIEWGGITIDLPEAATDGSAE